MKDAIFLKNMNMMVIQNNCYKIVKMLLGQKLDQICVSLVVTSLGSRQLVKKKSVSVLVLQNVPSRLYWP